MTTRKRPPGDKNQPAQWLDAKGARRCFSIHRTTLGRLVAAGEIRTVSLREPGCRRGKRLYEVASIERLLERRTKSEPVGSNPQH